MLIMGLLLNLSLQFTFFCVSCLPQDMIAFALQDYLNLVPSQESLHQERYVRVRDRRPRCSDSQYSSYSSNSISSSAFEQDGGPFEANLLEAEEDESDAECKIDLESTQITSTVWLDWQENAKKTFTGIVSQVRGDATLYTPYKSSKLYRRKEGTRNPRGVDQWHAW